MILINISNMLDLWNSRKSLIMCGLRGCLKICLKDKGLKIIGLWIGQKNISIDFYCCMEAKCPTYF